MRKFLGFLLVIAMISLVMGCSQTPDSSSNADNTSAEATSSTQTVTETAEIEFWDMAWGPTDVYEPVVKSLVGKFNDAHEGINVTYQIHAWDNYYQDYLTAVTSGMAPDVTNGAFNQSIQYAVMDELIDLGSIADAWKESGFYNTFPAGSFELHQYNGVQVGIPWIQDARMTTYSKSLFEKAGITEMPETWDEFRTVCETILDKTGVTPWAVPGTGVASTHFMIHMLLSAGVGVTDADGNANFNSPEAIKVMEFIGSMFDAGLIAEGSAGYDDPELTSLLAAGEIAMYTHSAPNAIATEDYIDNLGIMPPFTMDAGMTKRGLTWLNPMVAYKQGEHHEESKTFIKWWVENNVDLFTIGRAHFSASSQVNDNKIFSENPLSSQIVDKILPFSTVPTWPTPYLYEAFSQVDGEQYPGRALGEILTGNRDYEGIADKYNDLIAKAIADFS